MFPKLILASILLTSIFYLIKYIFDQVKNISFKDVYSAKWTYEQDWTIDYPTCAGKSQSPIDINESGTIYDSKLKNFEFFNYDKLLTWNVKNDGHSSTNFFESAKNVY